MSRSLKARLIIRAFWQVIRYDVINCTFGFKRVHRAVLNQKVEHLQATSELQAVICDAVAIASCFYWRPVLCLQRSFAATILLRKHGVEASLVIGYRPAPFFSHAWVEVNGRVVNDSPAYKERLQILCTV